MMRRIFLLTCLLGFLVIGASREVLSESPEAEMKDTPAAAKETKDTGWKNKDDAYWREHLTPEQYRIRKGGTEAPFTGKYYLTKEKGMYVCSNCSQPLFSSDTKYDSKSGWPSFFAPVAQENVELLDDGSHGMDRTEVRCPRCGAHLGHVFDDGPNPTGKRYCINSESLLLEKEGEKKSD